MNITTESDVQKVINTALSLCQAIEDKENFSFTEEEEALIIQSPTDFETYKNTLGQTPEAEIVVDRSFIAVSKYYKELGRLEEVSDIWSNLAQEHSGRKLEQWARTQLFLAGNDYDEMPNLISNPSFEGAGSVDTRPLGWSTYRFPNSECIFRWDNEEAHSGSRSIAVRKNQINGGYLKGIAVQPGERYYLAVWVKRVPAGKEESYLTVRWQDNGRWVDQGVDASPMVVVTSNIENNEWTRIECTFTVPWNATSALILLKGGQGESEENGTWFDDIFLCRIL